MRPKVRFQVAPEDVELFRKSVGPVKPLRYDGHVPVARRRAGRARLSKQSRLAVGEGPIEDLAPWGEDGDGLSHRRPGVPDGVLRKLRRGEYPIEGEIDLHGLTAAQAKRALHAFLQTSLARHLRCVRIIHGKGLRSGHGGPVLKSLVADTLRRTPATLAWVPARPADGGTGAVYVLLSSS